MPNALATSEVAGLVDEDDDADREDEGERAVRDEVGHRCIEAGRLSRAARAPSAALGARGGPSGPTRGPPSSEPTGRRLVRVEHRARSVSTIAGKAIRRRERRATATSLAALSTAGALSPGGERAARERDGRELRVVERQELERSRARSSVEAREVVRPALGPGERVLDREDHVVDRELREPASRRSTRPASARSTAGGRRRRSAPAGTSKSQRASISSSPLLTSVAESMVIFAPIVQVGCAQRLLRPDGGEGRGVAVAGTVRPRR